MESWPADERRRERGGSIQNGVTAASYAILYNLIGLSAGIGVGIAGAPIAAVATSRRNDTDSRTLFGRF